MAFIYDINKSCGTMEMQAFRIVNNKPEPCYVEVKLFEGNGFLAGILVPDEHDRSKDQLHLMFVSEEHARICMGLKKNYDGKKECIYEPGFFRKLTLYRNKCREFKKIVAIFAEAIAPLTIEIKEEE